MISLIEKKRKARELLRSIRIAKDIILIDEEYFYSHSDKNWINTPLYEIREKGMILYDNSKIEATPHSKGEI